MRHALTGLVTAILILLSGCAGGGASTATTEPRPSVAGPEEIVTGAGAISGTVVDDENSPLADATVALIELSLQVASNEAGAFEFQNLPPGSYKLAAAKLGYESALKMVTVPEEEVVTVTFVLAPVAVKEAYHEVFGPLQGYFQCRASVYTYGVGTGPCGYVCPAVACVNPWSTAGVNPFPNDNSVLKFNISSEDVASVVGDMRWTSSAYGTSSAMRFAFSYDKRPGNHWWCSGEGRSPLQFAWNVEGDSSCANVGSASSPERPQFKDAPFRVYANVPFASTSTPVHLSYEQRFEMMATVFYGDPAPVGYTALPDG